MYKELLQHIFLIIICLVLFVLYVLYDYIFPKYEGFNNKMEYQYIKGKPKTEMEYAPFAYYKFAEALKSQKFEDLNTPDGNNELINTIYEVEDVKDESSEIQNETLEEVIRRLHYKPTEKHYTIDSIQRDIQYFNNSSNLKDFMKKNNST